MSSMNWKPISTAPTDRDFALRMRNEQTGAVVCRVDRVRSTDPTMVIQGPSEAYTVEWAEVGTPFW